MIRIIIEILAGIMLVVFMLFIISAILLLRDFRDYADQEEYIEITRNKK